MTNLLAAIIITLSTNVTVEDNRPMRFIPQPCPDGNLTVSCLVNHGRYEKYGEATEKTETEIVTRHRALRFVFEWKSYTIPLTEPAVEISRRIRVSKLESQWRVTQEGYTNAPRSVMVFTNSLSWVNSIATNTVNLIIR